MLDKNFNPKVSIVIPVYNGGNYLENAIHCALSQTYENIEVIVVNDGSTDRGETEAIALSYGDKIRYFYKDNGGVSSALNLGISKMTGDYFSWLSHDDSYTPNKVSDAVEALRNTPGANNKTIAYSWGNYIDGTGSVLKPFPCFLQTGKTYTGAEMVYIMLTNRILNGCCMLIPKSAFLECGGFHEKLRYSQDALMWYSMFFKDYSMVFDGKSNVMYRLHGAQTSRNRHDLFEYDSVVIAEILAPYLATSSTKNRNLLYLYAKKMARYNCPKVALLMADTAVGECRFSLVQRLEIQLSLLYGKVRGYLKKAYYKFVLRAKDK